MSQQNTQQIVTGFNDWSLHETGLESGTIHKMFYKIN